MIKSSDIIFCLFLFSQNANEMCLAEAIFSHKCFRELLRNNLPPQQKTFSPQSQHFFKRFLKICNRFVRKIWMLVMNTTLPKALAAFNNSKIIQPLHIICGTVWLSHSTRVKSFFQQVSSVYYSESASIGAFEPKSQWQGLLMIGLGSDERNSSSFLHKM